MGVGYGSTPAAMFFLRQRFSLWNLRHLGSDERTVNDCRPWTSANVNHQQCDLRGIINAVDPSLKVLDRIVYRELMPDPAPLCLLSVDVTVTLETRDFDHIEQIKTALNRAGISFTSARHT